MQLLNPAAFAFAFIIPLIILLYLLKPRHQEITVSSTYLWDQVLRDMEASTPWQRLKKNILLILQLLAAFLLLIALSRPLLAGGGNAGRDLFVVLDCSASMMATDVQPSRFAEAQRQAGRLIDEMAARDQMTLIAMGDQPRILLAASNDQLRLRQALDDVRVSTGQAALEPVLDLLASLSENSKRGLALIFTDGRTLPLKNDLSLNCPLEMRQLGKANDNMAITVLATRREGAEIYTLARVQNYGEQDVYSDIELWTDGKLFDARQLSIKAHDNLEVIWDKLPVNTQTIEAQLSRADYLQADNQAFAVAEQIMEQRVLLVSKGNIFLEKALQVKPGLQIFKTPGSSYGPEMDDYDLYIFDSYLPVSLPKSNTIIINPPLHNTFIKTAGELKNIAHLVPAQNDALLQYVDVKGWQLARSRKVETPVWGRPLLSYEDSPILLVGENPHRTVVFTFDLHESNIPLQTGFPILVHNLLEWLLPPGAGFSYDAPTASLAINVRPDAQKIILQGPGQKAQSYTEPFPQLVAAESPGLYSITQITGDKSQVSYLAKNLNTTLESNIKPVDLPVNGKLKTNKQNAVLLKQKEIWFFFIWAALFLLGLEWEVYRRGY
ncbi:MAG: VWA domain-containing protein [Syntrophomonadaceae bacterium]|nr:VWA domain-containing protein [Syntrophomonadaceae bacterium]